QKAAECYHRAIEAGDAEACYYLGVAHLQGIGVVQDEKLAAHYFEFGTERKCAQCTLQLGYCYQTGTGVDEDQARAIHYYGVAADLGSPMAAFNLGVLLHEEGESEAAVRLYEQAAAGGIPHAMCNLAHCYTHGDGVIEDLEIARLWFDRADAFEDVPEIEPNMEALQKILYS
ncbi:MAG: tetratricopeptide repeat protein, partial [Bacilli bacterium]